MAPNKMLIDATHPEETRVVVLRNGRVEEFDYESAARKLLRGNIYLAKVTRVEPSLQAAFVDYGGNRHGFLAFNEIHPDYYQIPMADRQALLEEEALAEAEEEAAADARAERLARRRQQQDARGKAGASGDSDAPHADDDDHDHDQDHDHESDADDAADEGDEDGGVVDVHGETRDDGDDVSDDDHADDEHVDDDPPQVIAEANVRDEVLVEAVAVPERGDGTESDAASEPAPPADASADEEAAHAASEV